MPRPTTTYSEALDTIGSDIVHGVRQPGSVMTLDQIQQEYRISRTVAREVMRLLESMSLIESRRRVGLIVQNAGRWEVLNPQIIRWRLSGDQRDLQLRWLTELRVAVEPWAANLAASSSRLIGVELLTIARRMRIEGETGDLDSFLTSDTEFHSLILQGSGNEMFAALSEVVAEVLAGRTQLGLMPHHPEPEALDLHENVARAIADGDPLSAMSAMSDLLAEVRGALFTLT